MKVFLIWFAFIPFFLLYVSLFVGRYDIAAHILRITETLGIFKSLHGIFAPEHRITSYKYFWDEQKQTWINLHELDSEHKGEHSKNCFTMYIQYMYLQSGPGSKHIEANAKPSICLFILKSEP